MLWLSLIYMYQNHHHMVFRERGGSVVKCRTPEREVRGSRPTVAVLCPWARHFTPRKYWLITQEAMAPSRHDWKIVDWDVKPQHNQPTNMVFQEALTTMRNNFLWAMSGIKDATSNIKDATHTSMSRITTKPTKWHVCPAKTQISLGICPSSQPGHPPSLIRVFAVRIKKTWVLTYTLSIQRRLWSDWADAQADLSLCRVHMSFCWFCHEAAQMVRVFTAFSNQSAWQSSQWPEKTIYNVAAV